MTHRLPLNWKKVRLLGFAVLILDLLPVLDAVAAAFSPKIAALGAEARPFLLFLSFVFFLPAIYLFAIGAIARYDCCDAGLKARNMLGQRRYVAWENIQSVELVGNRVRLVIDGEPPIIFPRFFDGYSVILYWLDRLAPASAPVLQPLTPKIPPTDETTFVLTPRPQAWLYASGVFVAGVLFTGILWADAVEAKFLVLLGGITMICTLGMLYDGLKSRWLVQNGELVLVGIFGPHRRFVLKDLKRMSKETDDDERDEGHQDWVLFFKNEAVLLRARPEWSRAFIGALSREAPRAEIVDYTEDPHASHYSVILL